MQSEGNLGCQVATTILKLRGCVNSLLEAHPRLGAYRIFRCGIRVEMVEPIMAWKLMVCWELLCRADGISQIGHYGDEH